MTNLSTRGPGGAEIARVAFVDTRRGGVLAARRAARVASKGRPYKTVVVEGFEVLIGRGDEENDALTFEVAAPEDFWLHVAGGTAGSHVVVRNPDGLDALPRPVLERAAALAAWHSKARGARRADVHVCRVADVSKRRGAPPGQVMLRRWTRVRIAPEP